jgi:hypothetical protein
MAMKRPLDQLADITTMKQAQNLYRRLGKYLSGVAPAGSSVARVAQEKGWREEAKEARRLLENSFGGTVRLTSASMTRVQKGGAERREPRLSLPTWSMRSHFTVAKPKRGQIAAPPILHIPLDDLTYEPLGVYYSKPGMPGDGLGEALAAVFSVRQSRQVIAPSVTYADAEVALLRERLRKIKAVAAALKEKEEHLNRQARRLERDIERRVGQRRKAGGSRGAGPNAQEPD